MPVINSGKAERLTDLGPSAASGARAWAQRSPRSARSVRGHGAGQSLLAAIPGWPLGWAVTVPHEAGVAIGLGRPCSVRTLLASHCATQSLICASPSRDDRPNPDRLTGWPRLGLPVDPGLCF